MTYSDVQRLTGVKRTTLQAWIDRGWIKPSIRGEGSGQKNEFNMTDIENIMLFKRSVKVGLSRKLTARMIKDHRKNS